MGSGEGRDNFFESERPARLNREKKKKRVRHSRLLRRKFRPENGIKRETEGKRSCWGRVTRNHRFSVEAARDIVGYW